MTARLLGIATAVTLACLSRVTLADPAAESRFHDALARRYYARGQYEEAAREFIYEQRIAPNSRVVFNIGLCLYQLRRPEEAYMSFEEYLASDDQNQDRRATATQLRDRLAAEIARITVTTSPPGARIFVDDRAHGDYGTSPRTIAVAPGTRRVSVELAGHHPAEAAARVERGARIEMAFTPTRIVGALHVASSTRSVAKVKNADGEVIAHGQTPLSVPLPPGVYEVSAATPGHADQSAVAVVREGETTTEMLVPRPLPKPTGDITVTSNISGAMVELDGRRVGFSPTVLGGIEVGEHQLRVHAQGTLAWHDRVIVRAGERAWVTVTLDQPASTIRSPVTWVVGGVGLGALVAGGVTGLLALRNHNEYESATGQERKDLQERGKTLNIATDILLGVGIAGTAAALALYWGTAERRGGSSTAVIARGEK